MTGPATARQAAAADIAVAVFVAALGVLGQMWARTDSRIDAAPASPLLVLLAITAGAVLLARRRHPFVTFAALVVIVFAAGVLQQPGLFAVQSVVAVMVACHALGRWSPRRTAVWLALGALALLVAWGAYDGSSSPTVSAAMAAALVLLPGVTGAVGRERAAYLAQVEARLADAERDRAERAEAAVVAERSRIARELHDVVAHHVSLIGVQASAARSTLSETGGQSRSALAAIEQSSRDALTEMRRLLHVLQPVGPGDPLTPQPTLADLPATAQRWREAGIDVQLSLTGPVDSLDDARSTCAYRIAEEALTNVARHSTARAARVSVVIGDDVGVDVVDDGPPAGEPDGRGRGLLGMRERAALFGGQVVAGPAGAGFRVSARLPRSTHV